jgi:hypothetical protein
MESAASERVAFRWTIGNVSAFGFESLRISVWSAFNLFRCTAAYAICVNSISIEEAKARTGVVPPQVQWIDCSGYLPDWMAAHFDGSMAEGVGWKFAPVRLFPAHYELSLDNDCIFWRVPTAIEQWLRDDDSAGSVLAEDVATGFGQFSPYCGSAGRNSGIRGLAPGFDFESTLRCVLEEKNVLLSSELDEQGLQVLTLNRFTKPRIVSVDEVTICSPFWPHRNYLGTHGAHFVGLNSSHLPWNYYDRPADEWKKEHWARFKPVLEQFITDFPQGHSGRGANRSEFQKFSRLTSTSRSKTKMTKRIHQRIEPGFRRTFECEII